MGSVCCSSLQHTDEEFGAPRSPCPRDIDEIPCPFLGDAEFPKVSDHLTRLERRPHALVTLYPELAATVRFVVLEEVQSLPTPLPRCQDLPTVCFHQLQEGDLLVAVSHAWSKQMHPDPAGKKTATMLSTLMASERVKNALMLTRVMLFFDFLSITQRPFLPGQGPRTPDENAAFSKALQFMHYIYLHADMLLHIDGCYELGSATSRGHVTVTPQELKGVHFCRVENVWQVEWVPGEHEYDIRPGDVVQECRAHEKMPTDTHPAYAPQGPVTIERRYYGASNRTPAAERGWVYLERFITMARVAMVGIERFDQCVMCTTHGVRQIIERGAHVLINAVEKGKLAEVLPEFKAELLGKRFSATSTDKRLLDETDENDLFEGELSPMQRSDAEIVCNIMDDVVSHLRDSWEEVRASVVDDAIYDVSARLYQLVQADPLLSPYFRGTKIDVLHKNQGGFLRELWLGRKPAMSPSLHRIWHITPEHFKAFLGHFDTALKEHFGSLAGPRVQNFRRAMRSYEPLIVQHNTRLLTSPDMQDTTQLAQWLREASEKARLGRLPEHCALQAAKRLQQAHAGKGLDNLVCPVMSTPAAARLVGVLPRELQAAGRIAWPGQAGPAPVPVYSPTVEMVEQFLKRFYEELSQDELLMPFFGRSTGSASHIEKAQINVLIELFHHGLTQPLHDRLRQVHTQLVISDFQFDRFLAIADEVGHEIDDDFGKHAVYMLSGLRKCVVLGNAGVDIPPHPLRSM